MTCQVLNCCLVVTWTPEVITVPESEDGPGNFYSHLSCIVPRGFI
jgi:hypothetical protein